ncbi:Protein O-linked-mannose beta-1,4-N-acetylglucosaminyltransferase 2 [Irineochytrium annulatum]|nr:Protein O-linked-mannose beta-1,4-N-acetylglucosaminyltransferase 2 [Irineochytrium annulatum]
MTTDNTTAPIAKEQLNSAAADAAAVPMKRKADATTPAVANPVADKASDEKSGDVVAAPAAESAEVGATEDGSAKKKAKVNDEEAAKTKVSETSAMANAEADNEADVEDEDDDDASIYPDSHAFYAWGVTGGDSGEFLACHPADKIDQALAAYKQILAMPEAEAVETNEAFRELKETVDEAIDDAYCITLGALAVSTPAGVKKEATDAAKPEEAKKVVDTKKVDEVKKVEETSKPDVAKKTVDEAAKAEPELVANLEIPDVPVVPLDNAELRAAVEKGGKEKMWLKIVVSRASAVVPSGPAADAMQVDGAEVKKEEVKGVAAEKKEVKAVSVTVADFDPREGHIIPKIGCWKYLTEAEIAPKEVSDEIKKMMERFMEDRQPMPASNHDAVVNVHVDSHPRRSHSNPTGAPNATSPEGTPPATAPRLSSHTFLSQASPPPLNTAFAPAGKRPSNPSSPVTVRRRTATSGNPPGPTTATTRRINPASGAASGPAVGGTRWGRVYVGALVIGAFALGLYVSGLVYMVLDLDHVSRITSEVLNGNLGSLVRGGADRQRGMGEPAPGVARLHEVHRVEEEWKKKYEDLMRLYERAVGQEEGMVTEKFVEEVKKVVAPEQGEGKAEGVVEEDGTAEEKVHAAALEKEKEKQMEDMIRQSKHSGTEGTSEEKKKDDEEMTTPYIFSMLPSSSVYCTGDHLYTRICRFRNLCYNPDKSKWFILRTNSSVLVNVPANHQRHGLLEAGTVQSHPWVRFFVDEVSPFTPSLRNIPVRYETELHFLSRRLHPHNIMHNLHDDVAGLFHLLSERVGKGELTLHMPFSLDSHRILFIDDYEASESTRPFQYLSNKPLRFIQHLKKDPGVYTCFRDAVVGNSKLTTWYQYGWVEPQAKIKDKVVNGLHVRMVAEWFVRRIGLPLGEDEQPDRIFGNGPAVDTGAEAQAVLAPPQQQAPTKEVDFPETDLIIVLARRRNRLILNEVEMAVALKNAFGYEVVFVRNEDHTFEQQVELMRRARVIIAMHGSILIMGMFARRGTIMLELFPYGVPSENYTPYKSMCELPGMSLIYRAWENKHPDRSIAHDDEDPMLGGINHLPEEEQLAIRTSTTIPTHLCCTNPYWLYRIYQDTAVDVEEIIVLLQDALHESRVLLSGIRRKNWEQDVEILPPVIGISDVACLVSEEKTPGVFWVSWDRPWTGVEVDRWVIRLVENDTHYMVQEPMFYMPGFKPGTEISFQIKAVVADGVEQEFGNANFCVV